MLEENRMRRFQEHNFMVARVLTGISSKKQNDKDNP
jgi:hypothetical protein